MNATAWRLYSCDDHLDLWNLPKDVWTERLPARFHERGPRVVEQGESAWWTCDGAVIGMYGLNTPLMRDYSATSRVPGLEDDGLRPANPALRLADMELDGVYASVIYGPNLFGLPIEDPELKAACLAGYNDWAAEFNRHAPGRLAVLPVLPTHAPAAALGELERVAAQGHRGVIISPFEFRCSDAEWAPFWDAAEAIGLPVSFHIGKGTSQVRVAPSSWELAAFSAVGPMQLDEPLAMMVYSGVLERRPRLRLVLAESGIGFREPVGAGGAEVHGSRIEHAHAHEPRSRERRHVAVARFDRAAERDRTIEDRIGTLPRDRPPAFEVPRGGRFAAEREVVDVVVDDRGAGGEAGERVARDLGRRRRHVRVARLLRRAVDRGFEDDRRHHSKP